MKVLIADKFPEAGRAAVARAGVEVVYDPELNDAALTAAVCSTGADVLVGTPGPDVIVAFGGSDRIVGLAGRDLICAGAGADRIGAGSAAGGGVRSVPARSASGSRRPGGSSTPSVPPRSCRSARR